MNQHLTWDQISDYLIGDASASQYARHTRQCGTCRSEVERLEAALSDFRGAVRGWTARKCPADFETSVVMDFGPAAHLNRLLMPESLVDVPWYQRIGGGLGSLAVHAAMVALLFFLGSLKPVQKAVKQVATLIYQPPPLKVAENKGGGGGGARQPMVKKADLPKPVPRQFTPPRADTFQTRLEVPSSLLDVPSLDSTSIGAATGLNAFNGNGSGAGIGSGRGAGIGNGNGAGAGTGSGGGTGGGIYRPGNGVTNPKPIYQPEPQYSEEARKAKWQGEVLLSLVVDETGKPVMIKVVRPLGLGLDEKAIEAVSKWRFEPGRKDGKPVAVEAQISVTFRLL